MGVLSIKRQRLYKEPYKGFYTEETIFNPWLGDYYDIKIFLCLFGIKIKTLHWYRLKGRYMSNRRPMDGRITTAKVWEFFKGKI